MSETALRHDSSVAADPRFSARYLVGDFEDGFTELGTRVSAFMVDENDWRGWPGFDIEGPMEMVTCPCCNGSGLALAPKESPIPDQGEVTNK